MLNLYRIRINAQGYNSFGSYYGLGLPLYECIGELDGEQVQLQFRAKDRAAAKAHVQNFYPHARFYR